MDKFFNSTFDALTNVVPGSCVIAVLVIFDASLQTLDDLLARLNQIEFGSAAFLVFISYVIGFAITPIGKFLYTKLGYRIWPLRADQGRSDLTVSEKFVLVRQFSSNNFKYIETWNMFCNLAHNLAFSALLLIGACLYRIIAMESQAGVFLIMAVVAMAFFFLFLNRAVVFRTWALNDLNATVDRLELPGAGKPGGS